MVLSLNNKENKKFAPPLRTLLVFSFSLFDMEILIFMYVVKLVGWAYTARDGGGRRRIPILSILPRTKLTSKLGCGIFFYFRAQAS